MTIEVVFISIALIWGGVELAKHFLPSWWDVNSKTLSNYAHERLDELEKKIADLIGGVK
jgi:hypothetical protein